MQFSGIQSIWPSSASVYSENMDINEYECIEKGLVTCKEEKERIGVSKRQGDTIYIPDCTQIQKSPIC
jgi:hypothetical protein